MYSTQHPKYVLVPVLGAEAPAVPDEWGSVHKEWLSEGREPDVDTDAVEDYNWSDA